MQRRRTTVGRGSFGHAVDPHQHAREVLDRILSRGKPLTEDAVFLGLYMQLQRKFGSQVFKAVRASKNVGGYRYFSFSPDIDLLEVRSTDKVIGYELKGYRRVGREMKPPTHYEGIDQAMALLMNPVSSPLGRSFSGSVFDSVYLAHPEGSHVDDLAELLEKCTPIGLVVMSRTGIREIVHPKPNPFLNEDLKSMFLSNLVALESYKRFRVNAVQ